MSTWTELTETEVLEAMPRDLMTLYEAWIDVNPGKADRLEALRKPERPDQARFLFPGSGFVHTRAHVLRSQYMSSGKISTS